MMRKYEIKFSLNLNQEYCNTINYLIKKLIFLKNDWIKFKIFVVFFFKKKKKKKLKLQKTYSKTQKLKKKNKRKEKF